ncbi:hypothetical protein CXB51_013711 [Gossypium anomalum]|uniref:DUF4283 domain-containing protein n=1 Tax=Gossypium anomalum TaxID=47600 RepID=A0A8J5YVL1_9ROSI|nr:hypothetical protein CXB51_013711 [Gossypium anomalum]
MELTIIVKLLWRNIGYNALHNRIFSLWKPVKSIRIMDTINGPEQSYPSMVLAWIRLPSLPGHLYKRKIIEAIGSLIGKVVKLDVQTDNQTRERFARLAVYINLEEPLISQVLVDGVVQRVEYEPLPIICFSCGK